MNTGLLVARTALAAAVVVALPSACDPGGAPTPDRYVVTSVEPSSAGAADGILNVTCESTQHPGQTKTKLWDPFGPDALDQPAPVVGREWLCNEGDS